MGISVAVRAGSTSGTFKIEVDGDVPDLLWIRWYSSPAGTISEPVLIETPYDDTTGAGILVVDALRTPPMPFSTGDIAIPAGARWVLAVAWALLPVNPTLVRNSGKHDFGGGGGSSSSSSSSSSRSSLSSSSSSSSPSPSSSSGGSESSRATATKKSYKK